MQKHACTSPNKQCSHMPVPHWNCGTLLLEKPGILNILMYSSFTNLITPGYFYTPTVDFTFKF